MIRLLSSFLFFTSRSNARFWFQSHEFKILNFDPFLITLYPSFTFSFSCINPLITHRSGSSTFIPSISRSNASFQHAYFSYFQYHESKIFIPPRPTFNHFIFFCDSYLSIKYKWNFLHLTNYENQISIHLLRINFATLLFPLALLSNTIFLKIKEGSANVISMTWFLRHKGRCTFEKRVCSVERTVAEGILFK